MSAESASGTRTAQEGIRARVYRAASAASRARYFAGSVAQTSSLRVVTIDCPRFALGPTVARSIRADLALSGSRVSSA